MSLLTRPFNISTASLSFRCNGILLTTHLFRVVACTPFSLGNDGERLASLKLGQRISLEGIWKILLFFVKSFYINLHKQLQPLKNALGSFPSAWFLANPNNIHDSKPLTLSAFRACFSPCKLGSTSIHKELYVTNLP